MHAADLPPEMPCKRRLAFLAQPAGALFDDSALELRHPGRRRAGPWGERKHVQLRQPACIDEVERASEHLLRLGRETGDDVGAESNVGTKLPHVGAKSDGILARMPPLHALEDEIVARLQR